MTRIEKLLSIGSEALGDPLLHLQLPKLLQPYALGIDLLGKTSLIADSMESWADVILSNYRFQTGWTLAHDWQQRNGPLRLGMRLHPKIPFVLGGAYSLDNMWEGDAAKGMLFKGEIAQRIKNLPEGSKIRLRVME